MPESLKRLREYHAIRESNPGYQAAVREVLAMTRFEEVLLRAFKQQYQISECELPSEMTEEVLCAFCRFRKSELDLTVRSGRFNVCKTCAERWSTL